MDIKMGILSYYHQHSVLTNPGEQTALYHDLPRSVPDLVRIIQGVLIHPGASYLHLYHLQPEDIDNTLFGLRRVGDLLAHIQKRHHAPLAVERPPALRVGATCRNFAILLVSMLRHLGIPARYRVGFGGYFSSPRFYDHRIAEYWDNTEQRWILTDPMIDEIQRRFRNITFNTLDIKPDDPFRLAGEVWQRCRTGELDPDGFGDSDTDIGMPPIRYALLQDFAGLNKCEILGSDDWGELITKPEAELTGDDLALLDRIAKLTINVDGQFDAVRSLFAETAYGQTVQTHMMHN